MRTSDREIDAMWKAVFGQPPPIQASTERLIEILVECLTPAPPYGDVSASPRDVADGGMSG